MVHFFQTEAANIAMTQAKTNSQFYQSILKLIHLHGREEEPLTIFDLENMLLSIPGMPPELAIDISELASNAGREYVSAHEIARREQELTSIAFKASYLGYLLANTLVQVEDLDSIVGNPFVKTTDLDDSGNADAD